jgi:hypothetical protein
MSRACIDAKQKQPVAGEVQRAVSCVHQAGVGESADLVRLKLFRSLRVASAPYRPSAILAQHPRMKPATTPKASKFASRSK